MATSPERASRWRSTQLKQRLRMPSSNHLMSTGSNDQLAIRVGGRSQSIRCACSAQKPSGSASERRYMASYSSAVQLGFWTAPGGGGMRSGILLLRASLRPGALAARQDRGQTQGAAAGHGVDSGRASLYMKGESDLAASLQRAAGTARRGFRLQQGCIIYMRHLIH